MRLDAAGDENRGQVWGHTKGLLLEEQEDGVEQLEILGQVVQLRLS
jgi:hypothetical protein